VSQCTQFVAHSCMRVVRKTRSSQQSYKQVGGGTCEGAFTHTHTRTRFIIHGRIPLGNSMCYSAADSFHFIYILYTHARAYGGPIYMRVYGITNMWPILKRYTPPSPTKVLLATYLHYNIPSKKKKTTNYGNTDYVLYCL